MTHPTEYISKSSLSIEIDNGDVIITRSNNGTNSVYRIRGITDTGLVRVRESFSAEETEYGKAEFLEMLDEAYSFEVVAEGD